MVSCPSSARRKKRRHLRLCCYVCYVTGVFFFLISSSNMFQIRFISSSNCWSCCLSIFSPLLLLLPFCWCTCCQHCRGSFFFFFFSSSFLLLFFFFFFSLRLLKLPRLCASSFSYSCCSSCCCLLAVVPYSLVKKTNALDKLTRWFDVQSSAWTERWRRSWVNVLDWAAA